MSHFNLFCIERRGGGRFRSLSLLLWLTFPSDPVPLDLRKKKRFEKKPKKSYFGTPIVEGPDFVVASARECCEACANYRPAAKKGKKKQKGRRPEESGGGGEATDPSLECTLWVFCGDEAACGEALGQCWLKHLAWPKASNPRTGPDVPWTSGLRSGRLSPALEEEKGKEKGGEVERRSPPPPPPPPTVAAQPLSASPSPNRRAYHVAITASGPAVHWQSRVHYYWYLKQKRLCEEEARRANEEAAAAEASPAPAAPGPPSPRPRRRCDMGGFTRVLHDPAGTPDDLSREIPTFVARPLPGGADGGYVVLNRPWAFVQWLAAARVAEPFVLMAEPDHLWLRPLQNPCPRDGSPAAFPFFYIEPSRAEHLPLVARALGRRSGRISRAEAEEVAPVGNSPTWMRTRELARLAPLWMRTSQEMFRDAETRKAWGWVLEMYGFAVALHRSGAEARRLGEEAAVLGALAARAKAKAKAKEEGREERARGGGSSPASSFSPSSLPSFPPLSSEASEVALEARRVFRREQRQRRRRREEEDDRDGDDDGGGGGGGGNEDAADAALEAGGRGRGSVRVLPRVMLQPPWDALLSPGAALLHYTYGCDYSSNGTFLPGERGQWRFDKREWSVSPPTRRELRTLKESAPLGVRESAPATLRIVEMLLEAAEAIPGWEEYAESGTATEFWDGETFL